MSQTPSVGRIVHFHQPPERETLGDQRYHAAIITRVHSPQLVDVRVFFADGQVGMRTSISDIAGSTGGWWAWPERVA